MSWKALIQSGHAGGASQPPINHLVISVTLLLGVVPWLLTDGEFLFHAIKYRPKEKLLTIASGPMFFYILVMFCLIGGLFSMWELISGYKKNIARQKLNQQRQAAKKNARLL